MVYKGGCTIRELAHLSTNALYVSKWFPVVGSLLVYKRLCELLAWLLNGRVFLNVMTIIATARKLRNWALLRSKPCVAPYTSVELHTWMRLAFHAQPTTPLIRSILCLQYPEMQSQMKRDPTWTSAPPPTCRLDIRPALRRATPPVL